MAEIHTRVLTKKLIKPSTPTPANLDHTNLSLFDRLPPSTYINIIYYYSPINQPKPDDQIRRRFHLQTSLSDTLTTFYPLAGRYVKDDHSVKCNDQGVGYTEVEVDGCRMVDFLDDLHGQRRDIKQVDQLLPHQGVVGPYPDDDDNSTPLVTIQVNLFKCGGVAIGVCVWHKIADGFTTTQFINEWAKMNNRSWSSGHDDHKLQLQNSSFNVGSLFPVKNFPVEMPPLHHDPDLKIVTRRFVFNGWKISSLRTEFEECYSKLDGGVSLVTPSRVALVTAVLWKALISLAAQARVRARYSGSSSSSIELKNLVSSFNRTVREQLATGSTRLHSYVRPSLISPAMNLRGRTLFPVSNNSFGNFWTPLVAHFKPNNVDKNTLTWQDLVHPITDAIQTTANLVQHASSDEISSATIKAYKEVHEAMAGGHGEVDVFICTSWCRFAVYEADFGWGKPACVSTDTRPPEMFTLMDSSSGDDGIEAWVFLGETTMQLLEQDPDIIAFTST